MNDLPFLLQSQHYSRTFSRKSLDFQSRMSAIFGGQLLRASSMTPYVLILTRTDDSEMDTVGLQLAMRGIPYLRVDVDILLTEVTFNLYENSGNVESVISSRGWELCNPHVILSRRFDVTGIPSLKDDLVVQSFARNEWEMAVRSLLSIESASWINHPDAISKLDRISQLRLAHSVHLMTPKTLVSNDFERIRSFIALCSDKVIVKVLGNHFVEPVPGTVYGIFPQVITRSNVNDLKMTALIPSIYQEYVLHTKEIRVTIIGHDITAVEVTKAGPEEIWERPDNILIQNHTLPLWTQERLQKYMKLANLEYGAFDLLLTPAGHYVFLEVNPTGDWLWLEKQNADVNITEKVVSYIARLMKETSDDN